MFNQDDSQKTSKELERCRKIRKRINSISSSLWKIIDASERKCMLKIASTENVRSKELDTPGIRDKCLAFLKMVDCDSPWMGPSETRLLLMEYATKRFRNLVCFLKSVLLAQSFKITSGLMFQRMDQLLQAQSC